MDDSKFYLGITALLLWMLLMFLFATPWCIKQFKNCCFPGLSQSNNTRLQNMEMINIANEKDFDANIIVSGTCHRRHSDILLNTSADEYSPVQDRKTSDMRVHWHV